MNELFMRSRGVVTGPFTLDEIREKVARGDLVPLHEVSYDGTDWMRAGKIWDDIVPRKSTLPDLYSHRPSTRREGRKHEPHPESQQEPAKPEAPKPEPTKSEAAKPSGPVAAEPIHDDDAPLILGAKYEDPDQHVWDDEEYDIPAPKEPLIGYGSLRALTIAVAICVFASIGLEAIGILMRVRLLDEYHPISVETLRRLYESPLMGFMLFFKSYLVFAELGAGILLLAWVYFTARYLFLKSEGRMKFTPAWSLGWFFVPIANLWKPAQVVTELQKRSEAYLDVGDPRLIGIPIVRVWWICHVMEFFAERIAAGYERNYLMLPRLKEKLTPSEYLTYEAIPTSVYNYLGIEIASLSVGIATGLATLLLLFRFDQIRPKWSVRSRRHRKLLNAR